ncbi:acyltransferase family protein [Fibrobacter succinogenes subsp. succinogenes S85]|uniref:Acyltransferase family protein n=1 Tax=Fibrobacter succinogenes (strain ATCC 19169 / S85) TaxID=59374 RepID=D9S8L3_FIBSS|nr:acyltransferase [Fibrobacter succinogenes]ADL26314.1 acyltransferase family protein [Fibrobacter succinogenes subsp. succinogenes S85]
MSETKQYNYCLDFIKGIACICVVFMHCEFPGLLGTVVQAVSRFCVPLFFMVSGYFCYFISANPEKINSNMARKIKHVGKITLYACVAYVLFDFVQYFVFGKSVFYFSKGALLNLLLFNQPFVVAGQYWFLFALLYDYVLFALVLRVHKIKSIYVVATIMIFVYILLAQGMHLAGIKIPNMYYRNFFVEGLCFFTMGNWIHAYKSKLKFTRGGVMAIAIVCTVLCLLERFLMGRDFGVNIVTFPQVFCLFLYAVNNPNKHAGVLQIIGKRYSMFVYIIHPIVWHTMEHVYELCGVASNVVALYVLPLIVVFITLLISHIIYYAKNSTHIPVHG